MNARRLKIALATVILAAVAIVVSGSSTYADPLGGDTDAEKVGGCSVTGTNCTSWGVTWVKQPLDEYLQSAERVGLTNEQKQDMIRNCAGMADPYVIRLAYVDFANGGKIQLGSVSGALDTNLADRNNAVFVDPSTIPGGISPAEAQALFNYALSLGVPMEYIFNNASAFSFDNASLKCGADTACLEQFIQDAKDKLDPSKGGGASAKPFFQAKTRIDVGDGIPEGPQETSWDGYTTVEFSTDQPSVTINFTHTMDYQPNGFSLGTDDQFTTSTTAGGISNPPAITDVTDTVNNFTPYTITTGGGVAGSGNFGVYTTSGASVTYNAPTQTISLSPGETRTVCSYINYNNKYANILSKKHIMQASQKDNPNTPADDSKPEISHYDWYLSGYSGSGSSGACAVVTRPADPSGSPENPNSGDPNGNPSSNIMYAGETAYLKWALDAPTYQSRRLMERQITAHLVDSSPGREGRFFEGTSRSQSDPYGYYSGRNIADRHNFGDEGKNLDNSPDHYPGYFDIVVPDYVGYKYCHSGGYRYESWYAINGNWKHDTRSNRNYWYVYNASCRTIAKKPTVAFWNSGVMTAGGVITSSSSRFNAAIMGVKARDGGVRTLYGSWTEYLGVIGGGVDGFATGSSFARGSSDLSRPKTNEPLAINNSPLTISNASTLGKSGVRISATLRDRLDTYLKNSPTASNIQYRDNIDGLNTVTSGTYVVKITGDLTIDHNITISSGSYASIYQVPQVIIFVSKDSSGGGGNVKINGEVTRIDAWIIAEGNLDTCYQFSNKSTATRSRERNSYGDATVCDQQLTINGPVIARRAILNRSFGSDPVVYGSSSARYTPGEIFNLSGENYLWAYAQSGRYSSSYTEAYSRELAPRY